MGIRVIKFLIRASNSVIKKTEGETSCAVSLLFDFYIRYS